MKIPIHSILIISIIFLTCRDNRQIKYAGFDDLIVGSETINLYTNGEFDLEIGLGFHEGTYVLQQDSVFLAYRDTTVNLPHKFLLKDDRFESIGYDQDICIRRKGIQAPKK
ncbi:MAG: hypothetical protein AAGI38_23450 [Bacteroidota bacterium]